MPDHRPPGLLAAALLIARKDLAIELRTRSALFSALSFAVLAVVIFFFAWDNTAVASMDLAPGVLWVTFTFSGLLGLNRAFALEQADRAIDALLASPIEREAIFLGKALANLVFVGPGSGGGDPGRRPLLQSLAVRRLAGPRRRWRSPRPSGW